MSQTLLLHTIARRAEALTPDADLLARFTRERDQAAFEELVRRHGPLVWAVCRHLLPDHADAEDAFQAVFLALVRSGVSIRDGRTLPAWLHGVATRTATRAKRTFARRKARERAAAQPEATVPVSEGTWGTLVRAAHEEVQKLPEAERTAFVLCDLEGVSQPDAAARLGWPLGSLSGRLCKARQRLLDRLAARGIAPGVAVGIGLTAGIAGAVPGKLFDVVKVFPAAPGAASAVAQGLARGLTEVLTMRAKLLLTATVMVAAIGLTGGAALLSQADAQSPDVVKEVNNLLGAQDPPRGAGGAPGKVAPPMGGAAPAGGPGMGGFGGGMAGGPPGAGGGAAFGPGGPPGMAGGFFGAAPGVEHKFVDIKSDRKAFESTITQQGKDGWEFCGSERFGQGEMTLVFKKAKGGTVGGFGAIGGMTGFGGGGAGGFGGGGRMGGGEGSGTVPLGSGKVPPGMNPAGEGGENVYKVIPLKHTSADDVAKAVQKQFAKGLRVVAEHRTNAIVIVSGDADVIKAALKVIDELDAKPAPEGPERPGVGPPGAPGKFLNVFSLKNAKAAEMVLALKPLFPNADLSVDQRTNTILVRADEKTLDEIKALISRLEAIETAKPK